jgi:hypothetical protein
VVRDYNHADLIQVYNQGHGKETNDCGGWVNRHQVERLRNLASEYPPQEDSCKGECVKHGSKNGTISMHFAPCCFKCSVCGKDIVASRRKAHQENCRGER